MERAINVAVEAREFLLAIKLQEQVQEIIVKEATLKKGVAAALKAEDYTVAAELKNELTQLAFGKNEGGESAMNKTVSYTHLTLPTKRIV